MVVYKQIWIIGWFLLQAAGLAAQQIPYKLYTPQDGLPQSQIKCMYQDSRGYIWVGTLHGAAYFNGVKFQTVTPQNGLPAAGVNQIQEDSKGNIWFSTRIGLCKYDGKQVTYDTANIQIQHGHLKTFFIDKSFTAWCINAKDQFLYKSTDLKKWECVSFKDTALWNKKWSDIRYDKRGDRLLLYGESSVFTYQNGHLSYLSKWFNYQGYNISNHYDSVMVTRADSIFLLKDNDLYFIKKTNLNLLTQAIKRPNGTLYFATYAEKNLYTFKPKENRIDSFPLNISNINILFQDKDKNLWIGAEDGLIRIYPEGIANFDKKELPSMWTMVEDTTGGMWFAGYYRPNEMRYLKNGQVTIKRIASPFKSKGNMYAYFGGCRDDKGNLYFPLGYGIMKYDGKNYSVVNEGHMSYYPYLDKAQNRILSGTNGGVRVIDLKTGAAKDYGVTQGLHKNTNVLGICKDVKGTYWLGTPAGIAVLDVERDSIVKNYMKELKNFPYFGTMCMFTDSKNGIWAGSAQGLLKYDAVRDTFILVASTIIKTGIGGLAQYKDKYLVVGAYDGIYLLDLEAFYQSGKTQVRCFNQHNGYLGIEPNQNCVYVDSKDQIWVAASDIVTRFHPSELDMQPKPLIPYITAINNDKIPYESYSKEIELPYGINTAKIFFEAVGFERPFNTEFSYQLNGDAWSDWRVEDFAVLDNLPSGLHMFSVRTRPAGTVDAADIQTTWIHFKVAIPFYRSPNFPICAGILLFCLFSGGGYYVYQQRQREQRAERQMNTLKIETLLAQLNPHFIFNLLFAVQTRIEEGSRATASRLIVDLANLMRRFLESSVNMNLEKMRNANITLQQEMSLLESYIQFEQLQYSNRFDYEIRVEGDIDTENIQVPPMLIQPYVENAIKHGILYEKERRCKLVICFEKTEQEQLVCTIIDDGVGRKRAKEIQESFIRMYKSRGTQILDERIRIMREMGIGISVETKDKPAGGTIVELKIDM